MPPLKVFISYANHDRSTAELLYRDLLAAGAQPFEFQQSAMGDSDVFSEIADWISQCNVFVVLISAHSVKSGPVREEIRIAHYRYVNSNFSHPAKIIPAVIEANAEPPVLIERFPGIDLLDYAAGRATLFRRLDLKQPAAPAVGPALVLPELDLDEAAAEHARSRPTDQRSWLERAGKLVESYKDLKPDELPKEDEARHVDSLLSRMSGEPWQFAGLEPVDQAFLGIEEPSTTGLSEKLIEFDPAMKQVPLHPPLLRDDGGTLHWTAVPGATGYVLERLVPGLAAAEEYRGSDQTFTVPALTRRFLGGSYRVKATGGVFREDSAWSDAVEVDDSTPLRFGAPFTWELPPAPPSLELSDDGFGVTLRWSAVDGATGYILERTPRALISIAERWKSVHEGDGTTYLDFDRLGEMGARYSYRVKALGLWGETGWSPEVTG